MWHSRSTAFISSLIENLAGNINRETLLASPYFGNNSKAGGRLKSSFLAY